MGRVQHQDQAPGMLERYHLHTRQEQVDTGAQPCCTDLRGNSCWASALVWGWLTDNPTGCHLTEWLAWWVPGFSAHYHGVAALHHVVQGPAASSQLPSISCILYGLSILSLLGRDFYYWYLPPLHMRSSRLGWSHCQLFLSNATLYLTLYVCLTSHYQTKKLRPERSTMCLRLFLLSSQSTFKYLCLVVVISFLPLMPNSLFFSWFLTALLGWELLLLDWHYCQKPPLSTVLMLPWVWIDWD